MGILDFLFPKYCVNCKKLGDYICSDCFSYISFDVFDLCLICNRQSINGLTHKYCRKRLGIDGAFSVLLYKGVVKKIIYNFKYEPNYVSDLGRFLSDLFYEGLIQKESFMRIYEDFNSNLVLTPIPLHPSKLRKRGYNQSEILAWGLSEKLNLPVVSVLKRVKNTKSQYGLKKDERKKNMEEAFGISNIQFPISNFKYMSILLIDDILTTGSTLLEAARILKLNGAKNVWGITLARD